MVTVPSLETGQCPQLLRVTAADRDSGSESSVGLCALHAESSTRGARFHFSLGNMARNVRETSRPGSQNPISFGFSDSLYIRMDLGSSLGSHGILRCNCEPLSERYPSCIIRHLASIGGLYCLFYARDFIIRQRINVVWRLHEPPGRHLARPCVTACGVSALPVSNVRAINHLGWQGTWLVK